MIRLQCVEHLGQGTWQVLDRVRLGPLELV